MCKDNECPYTYEQLRDADYNAYYRAGSSPCEDCKNNRHSDNLFLLYKCQCECEEYQEYKELYNKYMSEYLDKLIK